MGKWASGSSTTTADTAAREDRRGHGQLSPDPLQSDPKRSSQPLEYFGSPSPKDVRVEPPGRADSSAPIKKLCKLRWITTRSRYCGSPGGRVRPSADSASVQ